MTLPNDPFDFLRRHEPDGPRPTADRTPGDTPRPGSKPMPNRAEPGRRFEPDLDAFFDDALSEDESELLYEHIRRERDLAEDMLGTQRALEALRSTPHCPDFSQWILKQVDRKCGLLSRPWMKRLVIGRVAIAAALLMAMGGLFALHRASPELATMGQPTPIGQLASALPADASRSQRSADSGTSGWTAGLDLRSAAMDSRAALHAQSIMHAGPESRQVLVDAGETLPLGGDGVVFMDQAQASAVIVRPATQIAVEFPGLQGFAIVHDPSHEQVFQAMLAAQPPIESLVVDQPRMDHLVMASAKPQPSLQPLPQPSPAEPRRGVRAASSSARPAIASRPAQPIVTDDCVYYMGRTLDRQSFQTMLTGFTALAPFGLD